VPELLWHFLRTYPRRTVTTVALLSVAGLAEGISVLALLPLLQISLATNGGQGSRSGQWIAWALAQVGLAPTLGSLLVLIVAGILVKASFTLLAMKEVGYAVAKLMTDLRQRLISALMGARWSYFITNPLGLFANALGAEAIRAGMSYRLSARFAASAIQALVYGLVTMLVSWQIALLALVAGVLATTAFRKLMAAAQSAGTQHTNLMRTLAARVTDTLQAIKPIKAMGAERCALPLLDREIEELDAAQRWQIRSAELLRIGQEPILVILLAMGIYVAIEFGSISLPILMLITVLFYRLFNRFQAMQEIYQQIGAESSAYWSIFRLCQRAERDGERHDGATMPRHGAVSMELADVSFGYGGKEILHNVSLRIAPGEFVTVAGRSGAGKTTLLDIVCCLLVPQSGRVFADGRDLCEIDLRTWRSRIGYVPQDMLLLHDTVYHNVCLGDETISPAKAEQALRAAGVWDVIEELPDGIHSMIGERGGRLSGGQRQRISLSRALAREPSLLLLDEITASLDEATEREVCNTLRSLAGAITIIAVSHQREMARVSDRKLVLENGLLFDQPNAMAFEGRRRGSDL